MIKTSLLTKTFSVPVRKQGFKNTLKHLFKAEYEKRSALNEISLSIAPGELVGLVGDNGAGKTTLIKLLSGIIHPSSGTAEVLGYTPWQRPYAFRQQISLVMGQKAQLWWDLPATDSFDLLKNIYKIEDQVFKQRLGELLEILSLNTLLTIPLRQLSLGERMKMELVAALLHQPKVIFLDEPTIGLDLQSQKAIRKFLKEYSAKYRPAVIITSHYMNDIEEICGRVILLQKGNIVYDGALNNLINNYAQKKLITVSLNNVTTNSLQLEELHKRGAEIVSSEQGLLTLKCPRELVKTISSYLITDFDLDDLKIEEVDLGTIIQSVFNNKNANAA